MPPTEREAEADSSLDELLDVLDHEYRRQILLRLTSSNSGRTVEPCVLTGEDDEPDVLELQLRHVHIPKLEDAELVEWNPEREVIARGPQFEDVVPLLDAVEEFRSGSTAD